MKSHLLLEFILNTSQNSAKSNSAKHSLLIHPNCEPFALFSRLDREEKGYIEKNDIYRFLLDNGVLIDSGRLTIETFIDYYDRDFDCFLSYEDFLGFVYCSNFDDVVNSTKRETYRLSSDEYLVDELEGRLKDCFISDFYLFDYANLKRKEIFTDLLSRLNCPPELDESIIKVFVDFDYNRDGYISADDICKYACDRKVKICPEELTSFIYIFDEDRDGKLNWDEFLFMILPSAREFEYSLEALKRQENLYLIYIQRVCRGNMGKCNHRENEGFEEEKRYFKMIEEALGRKK